MQPRCGEFSGPHYVSGLQTLGSLRYFELDTFALFERSESVAIDGGIMDEDLLPIFHCDEPVPLLRAEPFDSTGSSHFPRTSLNKTIAGAIPRDPGLHPRFRRNKGERAAYTICSVGNQTLVQVFVE